MQYLRTERGHMTSAIFHFRVREDLRPSTYWLGVLAT